MVKKETVLAFTGDISFTKHFADSNENSILDENISNFLQSSDYCIGNIEGPITIGTHDPSNHFRHCSDPKWAKILYDHNIRIWSLANNHMLDYGAKGLSDTLTSANRYGIFSIGAGETVEEAEKAFIIKESGGIAIISLTYDKRTDSGFRCMSYDVTERLESVISRLKTTNRWCIVVVHAGDEFADFPMPDTRSIYHKYLDLGADIVVGHHPHVVQPYELVRGGEKAIFYSLGNFIFDTDYQRVQSHTDIGIVLKLRLSDSSFQWEVKSVQIDHNGHCIESKTTPDVFTELNDQQYRRLWKMSARELVLADRIAITFVYPTRFQGYNKLLWLVREAKIFLTQKGKRQRIKGKTLSYITKYKKEDQMLLNYMKR